MWKITTSLALFCAATLPIGKVGAGLLTLATPRSNETPQGALQTQSQPPTRLAQQHDYQHLYGRRREREVAPLTSNARPITDPNRVNQLRNQIIGRQGGTSTPPAPPPTLDDDPAYRRFSGLAETTPVSDLAMIARRGQYCYEIHELVRRSRIDGTWPTIGGQPLGPVSIAGGEFADLMWQAVSPDTQRPNAASANTFAKITAPYEQQLKNAIMAQHGKLTPAQVLELSLVVTNGNYRLAVLTAHNLLKQVTYEGRNVAEKTRRRIAIDPTHPDAVFPHEFGSFAARLANLRSTPQSGVGRTDKMGIWYHSFVPLAISAWTDSEWQTGAAVLGEHGLRAAHALLPSSLLGNMGSPFDTEKLHSDLCFASAANVVRMMLPSSQPPELPPRMTPPPLGMPLPGGGLGPADVQCAPGFECR